MRGYGGRQSAAVCLLDMSNGHSAQPHSRCTARSAHRELQRASRARAGVARQYEVGGRRGEEGRALLHSAAKRRGCRSFSLSLPCPLPPPRHAPSSSLICLTLPAFLAAMARVWEGEGGEEGGGKWVVRALFELLRAKVDGAREKKIPESGLGIVHSCVVVAHGHKQLGARSWRDVGNKTEECRGGWRAWAWRH